MCAYNTNTNNNTNTNTTTNNSDTNGKSPIPRTRKAELRMNELEATLPFLPAMVTSKRRITSRDWNVARNLNESEDVSSLPKNFSFTDASLEDDPRTSALKSFSESERSIFSDSSIFSESSNIGINAGSDHSERCCNKQFCAPTDLDVLLGRGGLTNNHAGNIRYREEVEKVKPMYFSCLTKSEKKEVSELLVAYVQEYGGRFLEKDPDTGEWILASNKAARKKASQALRETKWKQSKVKKEEQPG